jgi:transposase
MGLMMQEIETKHLGHLGLISATMDTLGLMNKVNDLLGEPPSGSVSMGQRVGAMILNGLGFVNKALYLTPQFFHDKPLALLLGANLKAEQLNDDCLGRCLDKISEYGCTKFMSMMSYKLLQEQKLLSGRIHFDTTSLSLYGAYTDHENQTFMPKPGYSKANRPDLKQVILSMAMISDAHLPLWVEGLSGNVSDKKSFPETLERIKNFYQNLKDAPKLCFVADSALYSSGVLGQLPVQWLTRAPSTLKQVKQLYMQRDCAFEKTSDPRYQVMPYSPEDKQERWLLVHSALAAQRERETLLGRLDKRFEELKQALWHLGNQRFGCKDDAALALTKLMKGYEPLFRVQHEFIEFKTHEGKGRPSKGSVPTKSTYQIQTALYMDLEQMQKELTQLGRFVLATNIVDTSELSNEEMLLEYKEQTHVERGFRFIKNDSLGLDEIYLKSPSRIEALMCIMVLCLFVYNFAEYQLRQQLKLNEDKLPNQKGKPIDNPTLLWVFSLLNAITVVILPQQGAIVANMHPLHHKIIGYFGIHAKHIYGLPPDLIPEQIELNHKNWLKGCGM